MSVTAAIRVPPRFIVAILALSGALMSLGCKDEYSRLLTARQVRFISEEKTWALAERTPMPAYPNQSLRVQAHGPAVATVLVSRDGAVLGARILQAPDLASGEAFKQALSGWGFRQQEMPDGTIAEGTLTVYFELRDGTGIVVTAPDKAREKNPQLQFGRTAR